jgi:hypothetical protein
MTNPEDPHDTADHLVTKDVWVHDDKLTPRFPSHGSSSVGIVREACTGLEKLSRKVGGCAGVERGDVVVDSPDFTDGAGRPNNGEHRVV